MISACIAHYRIGAPLGSGGMGEVFRAEDPRLNRAVAVKILSRTIAARPDQLRRFEQEVKTLAALNHPNILTIHDAGLHEGAPYLVTELLEGRTLREELEGGLLPVRKAADYALQAAHGLAAAHQRGIVHRDLKPANLFIVRDGRVKILDFGLAKLRDDPDGTPPADDLPTEPGLLLGTPAYMSPEQVRGQPLDHRSDLFAFGAIFYEMLAGRHPFLRENPADSLAAILREDPAPLPESRGVPPSLARVLDRCLEKSPERRFQSAQDLAFAIEVALQNLAAAFPVPERGQKSLAVIPFANMSDDRENEFFADGISEDLITALSRVNDLRLPGRISSFAFKGRHDDIRRIGELLNVEALLTGSVRKSGNKLRITAQLVTVRDGFQLWSERYDRDLQDVFAIQDEITRAIVSSLQVKWSGSPGTRPTASTEAYELYVKGRAHWNQRGPGLLKAQRYFELALLEDPSYALAHAGLADCHSMLAFYNYLPASEAMPKARAAAERSVELDSRLAEAHAALGWVRFTYDWDWAESERSLLRALEIDPRYGPAHNHYSGLLSALGRHDEALAQGRLSLALDPVSPIVQALIVWRLCGARRFDEAHAAARRLLDQWPDAPAGYYAFSECSFGQGLPFEAVAASEKLIAIAGRQRLALGHLARAYALARRHDDARQILAEMQQPYPDWPRQYVFEAQVLACLGDKPAALASLQTAVDQRDAHLPWIRCSPAIDSLHNEPGFAQLLRAMNLPGLV